VDANVFSTLFVLDVPIEHAGMRFAEECMVIPRFTKGRFVRRLGLRETDALETIGCLGLALLAIG
jgi:hypothetical protein